VEVNGDNVYNIQHVEHNLVNYVVHQFINDYDHVHYDYLRGHDESVLHDWPARFNCPGDYTGLYQ